MLMKQTLFTLALAGMCTASPAAALNQNDIRACNSLAARAAEGQAEIAALKATRDELAQKAESAGSDWEDVEVHRNVSARHGAAADAARAEWMAARQAVYDAEAALQARVSAVNELSARFNARCASQ